MAEKGSDNYRDIQVFKGLQRPLELFGLQGRYVWWGVGSGGGGLLSLMIGAIVFGFLVGLILFTVIVGTGTIMILLKLFIIVPMTVLVEFINYLLYYLH